MPAAETTGQTVLEIVEICQQSGYNASKHGTVVEWLRRRLEPLPGVCSCCGCTDESPCSPNGCAWANDDDTLCTSCV